MANYPWQGDSVARARLTDVDFQRAAAVIGCSPAVIRAVWQVEAAGRGYRTDGTVERRFEPHHMPRATTSWRDSLRLPKAVREKAFLGAFEADPDAALRATSWGAPQIMGFNASAAGFPSAEAMVRAMAGAETAHLDAFVSLVQSWGLSAALRSMDWLTFARRYNGSGQPEVYARKIEAAYREASGGKKAPQVVRVGSRGAAVRRLQEHLGIEIDGAFGPETLAAVKQFQREHGLPVDGIVGARTWATLARGKTAPPAQETTVEALAKRAEEVVAIGGSGVAVLTGLREALPDSIYNVAVSVALGIGALALAAYLWRRWRS